MMETTIETMELLVSNAAGVYAWSALAFRYGDSLVWENTSANGTTYSMGNGRQGWMDVFSDEVERVDYWGDAEWYREGLGVKWNGIVWNVEQIDGDIWAIHPDAEWNDETETYEIKRGTNR